jgi:Peptidase_C39 like family
MTDESGHETIGGADFGAGMLPSEEQATPPEVLAQVEQLAAEDPQLAAELGRQELAAEQAIAQNPQEAPQVETEFTRTAIEEIAPVDPQLARELAAEAGVAPPSAAPSPGPAQDQPAPAPPPQQVALDEQRFAEQNPQLAAEIARQSAQASQEAIQDPQKAAQIEDQLYQTVVREVGTADPQLAAELSAQLHGVDLEFNAQGQVEQGPAPTRAVIGDPNQDASQWSNQGADGYCGPNSISMMLAAAAGVHISEQQVVDWATAHHDMSPLGDDSPAIPSIHVGMDAAEAAAAINALGAQYGVTAEVKYGNMNELEAYLKQGREVMVGVDAQQLWHEPGQPDSDVANHWVVVTGFDPTTDTVYINDSGAIYGKEEAVPLKEFESTWGTSNDVMIVTQTAKGGGEAAPGPVLLPVALDGSLVRPV